jgi:hypothetical protein
MVEEEHLRAALAESVCISPEVRVRAQGRSMGQPYAQAAQLIVRGREHAEVKVGSIILFTGLSGWRAHRVIRILGEGTAVQYVTRGDANRSFDIPYVTHDRLLGLVVGWVKGEDEIVFGLRERLRGWRMVCSGRVRWACRAFCIRVKGILYG